MAYFFHSRLTEYRDPFGAVAAGTAVHFRVRLPVQWHCSAVSLRLWQSEQPLREDGMFWAGRTEDDASEWWECHFTPTEPALYHYDFRLETQDGVCTLTRGRGGAADLSGSEGGDRWQLTCFAADFVTPDWLCGGVMYQIFPDRFAASGTPKAGVPTDRVLHGSWDEEPQWRPDEQGEIRNNDYFGGDLKGIEEKLDYLSSLGVTCLYLNPIFEAHSNHRYNTADYRRIDPMLGTEDDLRRLCAAAKKRGIRILLDGVFSHTGSDSRYFNKEGRYDTIGAYQSTESPYFSWYHFTRWPDEYGGWWGIRTLPEVEEGHPDYLAYMTGEDGVIRSWMKSGIGGWRLDVADELPDVFLDALREAVKAEDPDGLVLGEVWEDASCKHSYGHLRRYLLGRQLDSVMNYPFCGAILDFLRGGSSADFQETVGSIVENYPPQVTRLLMNHIGTHDTERALTALG
ncbi:MAG: glycoside hydrolase family 13 protein, partial [Clostridia bacterium]|nr:glycoside hydrolase family 13 protein [Clostridia bacterium]